MPNTSKSVYEYQVLIKRRNDAYATAMGPYDSKEKANQVRNTLITVSGYPEGAVKIKRVKV